MRPRTNEEMCRVLEQWIAAEDSNYRRRFAETRRRLAGPGCRVVSNEGPFVVLETASGEQRRIALREPESGAQKSGLPEEIGGISV